MSDMYLRRTDQSGRAIITQHIVWDADLFVASQQSEQRKLRDDPKTKDRAERIEVATQQDYRDFAWRKS